MISVFLARRGASLIINVCRWTANYLLRTAAFLLFLRRQHWPGYESAWNQGCVSRCACLQDVYPDSPASAAGFEPHTDYIVGTPDVLFNDSEDFFTLVQANIGKPTKLYVYSTNTDNVRSVRASSASSLPTPLGDDHTQPRVGWKRSVRNIVNLQYLCLCISLGCDVGYGLMHRIPIAASALPPDSQEESDGSEDESEEDGTTY